MDPVSIIVAAVIAGATSGVTDSVKGEVKTVYSALRKSLLERFRGNDLVVRSVKYLEKEPTEENKRCLTQSIADKGISADDELVSLANRVIEDSGLSVTQLLDFAEGASVKRSGVGIEGASDSTRASVRQEQRIGKHAVVEDSGVQIKYRPPSTGD